MVKVVLYSASRGREQAPGRMTDQPNEVAWRAAGTVTPPPSVAIAVRELIDRHGDRDTAARLGVSRATVARLAGSLTCRRGSVFLAARPLGIDLGDRSLAGPG